MDDRDQDGPASLAAERRPHDRGAVCPVGLDERGHRLGVDPAHARRPDERGLGAEDLSPRDVDPAADLAHGAVAPPPPDRRGGR